MWEGLHYDINDLNNSCSEMPLRCWCCCCRKKTTLVPMSDAQLTQNRLISCQPIARPRLALPTARPACCWFIPPLLYSTISRQSGLQRGQGRIHANPIGFVRVSDYLSPTKYSTSFCRSNSFVVCIFLTVFCIKDNYRQKSWVDFSNIH